jgi:DNA-binding transcriptional LysR family regulator
MTLQGIEAFVAVAESGSINRAAVRLHLTQPALSRRVQNFEAALGGAALLDRGARPSALTPIGRQVLEHCRRVLKAVAELEASTSSAGKPAGNLRIGIAYGLGEMVLSSPLDDLQRRFPKVRLQVSSNWTARLIEEVRNGALDCAVGLITKDQAVPAGVLATALMAETIVVVAARQAKLRGEDKDGLRLRDLASHGWILNPPGCACRGVLQRAFDRAQAPMLVAAEVFGEDLQLSMIARGAGLGLVPRRQLDRSRTRSRLRVVKLADFTLPVTISLLQGPLLGGLAAAVGRLQEHLAHRGAAHQ